MKKLFIAAIAVFTIGATNAQEVKFGAKASLNYATLNGDIEETDGIVGFAVGGFANVAINDKLSFQPELLYSTQGTSEKETEKFGTVTINTEGKFKLSYLNVPLMLKYKIAEAFSVEFGPQVGFILSAKSEGTSTITGNGPTTTKTQSEDIKDQVNSTDFGLNFGAGYDVAKNINIGLRYNLGLTNVSKEDTENFSIKNSVFALSVGFTF